MQSSQKPAAYQRSITDVIAQAPAGHVPFSVEFMPPRDDAAEQRLWDAARSFQELGVAFVSVTYGAGGSSRQRTLKIAEQLSKLPLTSLVHLTLVNHTIEELEEILDSYAQCGLSNLLALRGDPPGADPLGAWPRTPGGLEHAAELIALCRNLPQCQRFQVGIASFPEGHFRAPSLEADTHFTLEKLRAGADFSITQMFFDVEHYLRLRDRLAQADAEQGAKPIIPGLMPITSIRSLHKQVELSGASVPDQLWQDLERAERAATPEQVQADVRKVGIDFSTQMAQRLIEEGAPDLHFMTMNFARATQEVLHNLGMAPAWGTELGQDILS